MQITVAGTARASFQPELATVHLTLSFEGSQLATVVARTTELAAAFTKDVDSLAGRDGPVTERVVLPVATRSWRPWSNEGKQLPMRYAASVQSHLTFEDFQALSSFIDAWGRKGGVTIDGVDWVLTPERQEREEAVVLGEAVRAAATRAQTMATAAGAGTVAFRELADVNLLGDVGGGQPQLASFGARMAKQSADEGVDLTPADIEVTATVHARFTTG